MAPSLSLLRALLAVLSTTACVRAAGSPSVPYEFVLASAPNPIMTDLSRLADAREFNYMTYSVGLLVDPCRGRAFDCCVDWYGEPEYERAPEVVEAGWVWALSRVSQVPYKCRQPCSGKWSAVNESSLVYDLTFDDLDADRSNVWVLNTRQRTVFRRPLDGSTSWQHSSGDFTSISASGDGAVYALERSGAVWSCRKPCSGSWSLPREVAGHPRAGREWSVPLGAAAASQVEADATHVLVLDAGGALWARQVLLAASERNEWRDVLRGEDWASDAQWSDVTPPGARLGRVAASTGTESWWALDAQGRVLACGKPCLAQRWLTVPSPGSEAGQPVPLARLDADEHDVWATSAAGQVFRRPADVVQWSAPWVLVPAAADRSAYTLEAWATVPPGGFALVSPSAGAARGVQAWYTVEAGAQECGQWRDQAACAARASEASCAWDSRSLRCEKVLPALHSRVPDPEVLFNDPACMLAETIQGDGTLALATGFALVKQREGAELVTVRDPECVEQGVRMRRPALRPPCWDYNATVDAARPCTDADGRQHPRCVALGFTQTNYIVSCGGALQEDPQCGTFLEVHAPDDPAVINDVRVDPGSPFTHGFRTMALPTSFKGSDSRVLCEGDYEVWWVQRTRRVNVVELRKRFRVVAPLCQWNATANKYDSFAELAPE